MISEDLPSRDESRSLRSVGDQGSESIETRVGFNTFKSTENAF